MPPTRAEVRAYQESVGERYRPMHDTLLGVIKTAAVSFEHLTNDPHWDRFLSYIQAMLEEMKKERDFVLLHCGKSVGDALHQAQLSYQHANGYVQALEKVMALPAQLRSAYEEAKETAVPSSP